MSTISGLDDVGGESSEDGSEVDLVGGVRLLSKPAHAQGEDKKRKRLMPKAFGGVRERSTRKG
eukprot:7900680-Alexandrium_andersonii.AAC.1